MAFDGIVLAAARAQFHERLTGGKIEKIYQPEPDEILLHITVRREKYKLLLSANGAHPRAHLVGDYGPSPQNPPGFCMLLRKHIQGGRFSSITQRGSERVLEFMTDTVNELGFSQNKKLIVEIMGKHSNILLVDARTDRIIDSIKRLTANMNRYRQTMPGDPYIAPPSHDKVPWFEATEADFRDADAYPAAQDGGDREETLAKLILSRVQGIGPAYADELAARARRAADANPALSPARAILTALAQLSDDVRAARFCPRVYADRTGAPADFHVFPLTVAENAFEVLPFDDVSLAVDYFHTVKTSANRVRQKAADLARVVRTGLDKQFLKKQRLLEDLAKAEDSDGDRLFGELLTAHLHMIPPGRAFFSAENYYDGTRVEIPLDPRLSPAQNAQRYYKRYAKAKTAVVEKKIRLDETEKDIAYLESVLVFIENASGTDETDAIRQELVDSGLLRRRKTPAGKKPAKLAPLEYPLSDGSRALVGRNNRENDLLTFKKAAGRDLWLHTKDIPGSHVILLSNGGEPSETAVAEAAAIAAWHSKGRASENVPVDCTLVKHVKKPSGAKPGMVIFTHNRTLYVRPSLPNSEGGIT